MKPTDATPATTTVDPARAADLPAAAIGRLIAGGLLDPRALVEVFLERIAAADPAVFITVTAERARAEAEAAAARAAARRPLSPLDGVPIAWKDLVDLAGTATTAGSALLRDAPPATADAPVARAAAAAGMVTLGKVNLTEFAYSGIGLNPHFGTPRNPRGQDAHRSPGGSSSGSGVAVAAGLAPVAIGTDTGGSVRIPASFNGVVGYKSSEGRIDKTGVMPLSDTLDTVGPLTLTVEDCVLVDCVLRGAVSSAVTRTAPSDLTVIVPTGFALDDLEEGVARAFEASLSRLSAAGVTVRERPLEAFAIAAEVTAAHGTVTAAEAYAFHRARIDGPDRERIDGRVVARIENGKRMSAHDLLMVQAGRRRAMARLAEEVGEAMIAMPTTPLVAPDIAPLEADVDRFHAVNLRALRNTMAGNFLNTPGCAIPNGADGNGMPTSFLLSALPGRDEAMLSAALALEPALAPAVS